MVRKSGRRGTRRRRSRRYSAWKKRRNNGKANQNRFFGQTTLPGSGGIHYACKPTRLAIGKRNSFIDCLGRSLVYSCCRIHGEDHATGCTLEHYDHISCASYGKDTLAGIGPIAVIAKTESSGAVRDTDAISSKMLVAAKIVLGERGVPTVPTPKRFSPLLFFFFSSNKIGSTQHSAYILMCSVVQAADLIRKDAILRSRVITWHSYCSGVLSDIPGSIEKIARDAAESFADDYFLMNRAGSSSGGHPGPL